MSYTSKNNQALNSINISEKPKSNYLNPYQANRQIIQITNAIKLKLAQAYLEGLTIPDFLLQNFHKNISAILYRHFSALLIPEEWVLIESQDLAENSEELMKLQYNLPRKMFSLMLEEDNLLYPKYTMALWSEEAQDLKAAQLNMLEDAIAKANIQDGDSVLDIGCGWGSAANYILHKFPNAQVTGLNLSHEQCQYIRGKMQDPNSHLSSERFTLIEGDFNQVNFDKKFKKIISLGVFEHIGNLTKSLKKIASFLEVDGQVFIHIITVRLPHNIGDIYLDKYIFPRGRIWHEKMIPSCNSHLKTIQHWFINGSNYSQTLQAWLKNFDYYQEQIKDLDYGMNYDRFRRMWRLYLQLCIAYFDACQGEILGNGQYLMVHRN
jgi:cyclopropane-fatty-acyl-phospholipid synthase